MHVNESVGQIPKGTRIPDLDRDSEDTRTKRESRAERQGADAPRRREPVAETTRLPPQYGAGF